MRLQGLGARRTGVVGRGRLWASAERLFSRRVQTGLSDGMHTEVVTGLRAGDRVIVGRTGGT
jgi:hypothetical protein